MYKIRLFLFLAIISFRFNDLKAQNLSSQAEISIITCAPGNDLYSTFGHSAIRIKDPVLRIDNVYNYGTFNFETPGFYMKFMRGQLDYMLSVAPYKYFVISYMNENRWIKEQVLDLNKSQKNKVFAFLKNNALPENMYYRYDFFYDNCATRVKDVIRDVLGNEIILPEKITDEGVTYRDLLYIYLKNKNWERFGINLALGLPTDKVVTAEEATFLPDYLEKSFDKAVLNINGVKKPIVKETRMLFEPKESISDTSSGMFTPVVLFYSLLFVFLVLTFVEYKNKKYYLILDKTLFFIVGFFGFIILLLWFGTEHGAVINNQNIIWAMPLFFIAAFMLKKNNKNYIKRFFIFMSALITVSLIINLAIYRLFDFALIPLLIIIIFRSVLIFRNT
ncbi:MAG: DUF4105 domain-containing protein [Bacteroidales bacterium]|nr:DUF4105 domain-containing protein [Bacteroidales bacterium]